MIRRATARAFHVMTKPTGAVCNLDCAYCFFLSKEQLYPGSDFRMTPDVQQTYLRQLFAAHPAGAEVTVAYQGGEPTLIGLDFFVRSFADGDPAITEKTAVAWREGRDAAQAPLALQRRGRKLHGRIVKGQPVGKGANQSAGSAFLAWQAAANQRSARSALDPSDLPRRVTLPAK